MEDEAFITHRNTQENNVQLIDSDKQDQIVNDMKAEYERVVKTEHFMMIGIHAVLILLCLVLLTQVDMKFVPFIYIAPYAVSLYSIIAKKQNMQKIILMVEATSVVLGILTLKYFSTLMFFILHIIFFVLILSSHQSKKFRKEFPNEINELEKKKYPYKSL